MRNRFKRYRSKQLTPFNAMKLFLKGSVGILSDLPLVGKLRMFEVHNTNVLVDDIGDNVGRKESDVLAGVHELQSTSADRPVLGRVPAGVGVTNLLANVGRASDLSAGWTGISGGSLSNVGDTISGIPARRFTLSGGNTLHFLPTGNMLVAGDIGLERFYVDVSGLTTKAVVVEFSSPSTSIRFLWTAPQTVTITAGSGTSGEVEILGDYQAIVIARCTTARTGVSGASIFAAVYGNYSGDGEYLVLTRVQINVNTTIPFEFQTVTAAHDITQAGIPSTPCLYFNLVNTALQTVLPAGTYTMVFAGDKGIWIDENFVWAGGVFTYGPTAYSGGPAGIIGNCIGQRRIFTAAIPRALSWREKRELCRYLVSLGSAGVWQENANLLSGDDTAFASSVGTWVGTGAASISAVSGVLNITNVSNYADSANKVGIAVTPNTPYIFRSKARVSSGTGRFRVVEGVSPFTQRALHDVTSTAEVTVSSIFSASVSPISVVITPYSGSAAQVVYGDDVEIRRLTLNPAP